MIKLRGYWEWEVNKARKRSFARIDDISSGEYIAILNKKEKREGGRVWIASSSLSRSVWSKSI